MDAIRAILTRTSERQYLEKRVEEEKIRTILQAAMAAPSAVNKQPWDFIVVTDRKKLDALGDGLPYAKMLKNAPMAIIVCGNLDKTLDGFEQDFWIQDCANASQNILLSAHALGLGAVWTAAYPAEDRVHTVRTILDIPETAIPLNVIPIGYPEQINEEDKSRYNENMIHHDRW